MKGMKALRADADEAEAAKEEKTLQGSCWMESCDWRWKELINGFLVGSKDPKIALPPAIPYEELNEANIIVWSSG